MATLKPHVAMRFNPNQIHNHPFTQEKENIMNAIPRRIRLAIKELPPPRCSAPSRCRPPPSLPVQM